MKRLVIFDLDGTLLNTLGGIGAACNKMLAHYGFPQWGPDDYKIFIGNGTKKLIERALPAERAADDAFVEEAKELYLQIYRGDLMAETAPYEGVPELLCALRERGVALAVASNKFDDGTKQLIAHFFSEFEFAAVEGQKEGVAVKPDPTIVNDILHKAGVAVEDVLYVGDTGVDMRTAMNAGAESVGVTWGFRGHDELSANGANHIISQPSEILSLV
ncbi:MAG: HAD family hydrolase [Tidjanibacter sp.]|nr:HAD family hydrolase [Tidjanibacter sp.]